VIKNSISQLAKWRGTPSHPHLQSIHINISGASLQDTRFAAYLIGELEQHDLPPSAVHLEIAEFELMVCGETALENLTQLRRQGVYVNVDHLGEEELTLANLDEFPIDYLKIDRDFTSILDTSHNRVAMLHLILRKAQNLNIRTIAVGVEDPSQLAVLQSMDCDYAQGNLLCRPLRAEQMNGPLPRTILN
jgi:EAL domain-containing protein (putative c-di-GMP-specific phosphodiesterase class I)